MMPFAGIATALFIALVIQYAIGTLFHGIEKTIAGVPTDKYSLYILMATGAIISIISWFWLLFFCMPFDYYWRHLAGDDIQGSCKGITSLIALTLVHAAWLLIADFALGVLLPFLLLRRLQM
ncbi:hypothetical protein BDV12DRAFT_167120 [Aspergillus spectabilis]